MTSKENGERVDHTFGPFIFPEAKILILGSVPSPKSREMGFYYGHPQNRFWKVLSKLFDEYEPLIVEDRKIFLVKHKIALWDVVESCIIHGASDSSIKDPIPTDIAEKVRGTEINAIFATGKTAHKLLKKLQGIDAIELPSTSPANCAMSMDELLAKYRIILNYV